MPASGRLQGSTHCPMGIMSPVSANGINSAGETRPLLWCQRTRASKPTILPVSTHRLIVNLELPDARSLAAGLFRCSRAMGVHFCVKQRITCLTENLGTIHCCVSITQERLWRRLPSTLRTMPILVVTNTSCPLKLKGNASLCWICSAIWGHVQL